MHTYSLVGLLIAPYVAANYPSAQIRQTDATTVPSTVEDGIQTECKACPYSLCTNTAAYEYNHDMTLTCWTRGDNIVDTEYVIDSRGRPMPIPRSVLWA